MDRADSSIKEVYHTFIREEFAGQVRETNSHYPSRLSVRLDWEEIDAVDKSVGRQCLTSPKRARECFEEAIDCWDEVSMPKCIVRFHNIPDDFSFRVGKQRSNHLGRLITVTGEVAEMGGVQPYARVASLECLECGARHRLPQTYGKMMEPVVCRGCDKSSADYRFMRADSDLIDYRKVILRRSETTLDEDPPTLVVYLTHGLVERVGPGDQVSLVGFYDTARIQKETVLSTYLDTFDIESHQEGVIADKLSPSEISELIYEKVEAHQADDPSSFGVPREDIVDQTVAEGIREKEVEAQLESLLDEREVAEVGGGKLMIV